jgi:outer membrane protein assembly factor BamE
MQKLLIYLACIASLQLVACSSSEERANAPRSSLLERIPIVYRPDIQQGNTIDQELVNQLKPGMTKAQVRFLLGTPMLVDVFHHNRWDYVYTMTEGWDDMQQKRVALFFEDDRLVSLEGDFRPEPGAADSFVKKETVVSVPDNAEGDQGVISRAIRTVGDIWDNDNPTPPAAKPDAEAVESEP